MIEDLKSAWREAVDNFWRELRADAVEPDRLEAMRRDIERAREELRGVRERLRRTRRALREERAEERACNRRARLAEEIDDAVTARVARRYAARHEERRALLERKVDLLEAERDLRRRELDEMRGWTELKRPNG